MQSRVLRHLRFKGEYRLCEGQVVGTGLSGQVLQAAHKVSGRAIAAKRLPLSAASGRPSPEELSIYARLSHPNICRLLEAFVEPAGDTWLCMEYCSGGELFEQVAGTSKVLRDGPTCDTEERVACLFRQMAAAFRYLHGMGVVHRDNKLENWVFASPAQERIKLIDFGFATLAPTSARDPKLTRVCGTCYYVAPEVFSVKHGRLSEGEGYGCQVDIWALGVILYMLVSGSAPFTADHEKDILWEIAAPQPGARLASDPFTGSRWKNVSRACRDLISGCLQRDPRDRLTALGVQEHRWLRRHVNVDDRVVGGYPESIAPLLGELLLAGARFVDSRILACFCGQMALRMFISPELWTEVRDSFFALEGSDEFTPKGSLVLEDLVTPCLAFCNMEELRTRCPRKAQLSNEDLCRQLLRSLDLTGDGRLHFFEFLGAIIGCGRVEVKESDVASAFSALDVDCDGAVSAADLPSFVTAGAQDGVLRLPVTSVAEVFAALQVQLDFTASLSSKLRAAFERSSSGPLELHRERSRSTDTDSGTSPTQRDAAHRALSKAALQLPWQVPRCFAFDIGIRLGKAASSPSLYWPADAKAAPPPAVEAQNSGRNRRVSD